LRSIELPAANCVAHWSGALLLKQSKTLLIADAHLGYSWAQRRRGELGPLADELTRQKLMAVQSELSPERIVFVGDLVHAPRPCSPEREWIESVLGELGRGAELIAVRGNHDRAFAREFGTLGVQCVESWSDGNVFAIHGDRLPDSVPAGSLLICGHLHPSLCVRDSAGAGQRLPLFLATSHLLLLPAFSPFARGYDVLGGLPPELYGLFGENEIDVFAASATRIVRLGPLHRVVERVLSGTGTSPAHFRRSNRTKKV
jgi:uncharacterized protein